MQSANEIKHHIGAVEQTRKITNAMDLISSARMKKVMHHIDYNKIYFSRVQSAMKDILMSPHPVDHPYLRKRKNGKKLYIVVAGDKGMAGSYNSEILEFAYEEIKKQKDPSVITIGLMAGEFFKAKGIHIMKEIFGMSQDPSLYNARKTAYNIIDKYGMEETDEVFIIFTSFDSRMVCTPCIRRLLPIRISDFKNIDLTEPEHEILYVPSANEVFGMLVPQYLVGMIFGALVQAYAGEHYSRMVAMQSATHNADELLKKLKLEYNMARQASITQEISEITGAAAALNGGSQNA
ncbi:MAG: ATP synthase F1 subunit gamma [Clostridiales bacterium]|nr:ATP synthase F1 subunit gamma [Clostridiales bacterium]